MTHKHLAGTQIGEMNCPSCGAVKPIKINIAGCAYMFCREQLGERDGKREDCFTRLNWGRMGSTHLINQYLDSEGATQNVQHEDRQEQSGNEQQRINADKEQPAERASGIFGNIFTGNSLIE